MAGAVAGGCLMLVLVAALKDAGTKEGKAAGGERGYRPDQKPWKRIVHHVCGAI